MKRWWPLIGALAWFGCGGDDFPEPPRAADGSRARSLVVVEGVEGAAAHLIRVYEPLDGAKASVAAISETTFRWSSVPDATSYLFLVTSEVGDVIWRATVRDTVATLPEKVSNAVMDGTRLKWLVQAPLLSASSDIHRIELTP